MDKKNEIRETLDKALESLNKIDDVKAFIILAVGGGEHTDENGKTFSEGVNACGGPLDKLANLYNNIDEKIVKVAIMRKMLSMVLDADEKEQNNSD